MNPDRRTEVLVGLFLFVGLAFVGALIVTFGSAKQQMRHAYEITVEFPKADGLIRNSPVMLAGAPIGVVAEPPELVKHSLHAQVKLKIRNDVQIPRAATFHVGSSSLLGDKYVEIAVPAQFDPDDALPPGSHAIGARPGGGFEQLTDRGSAVMTQVETELKQLELLTATLHEKLLSEKNLQNLQETFGNLKDTTENLKTATQNANAVIKKAEAAVDSTNGVMKNAEAASTDLRGAIGEARKTADAATKTIDSAQILLKKISEGDGALGALINDRKMADDLKSLVSNLRHSGILFYRDRQMTPVLPKTPSPVPQKR